MVKRLGSRTRLAGAGASVGWKGKHDARHWEKLSRPTGPGTRWLRPGNRRAGRGRPGASELGRESELQGGGRSRHRAWNSGELLGSHGRGNPS
uniref:Uncharacterized protein n=1 Tax=Zea mays TaxID=4577 RepID=C4IZP6_MAIZE|nr:unknown [Zea mays]